MFEENRPRKEHRLAVTLTNNEVVKIRFKSEIPVSNKAMVISMFLQERFFNSYSGIYYPISSVFSAEVLGDYLYE